MSTIAHKTFTYRTSIEWSGRRSCILTADGKPTLRVSSPPEFRGERDVWTPEDFLVASVETCYLMTFAGLTEKRHLAVEAYSSYAEGVLEWTGDGYAFTRITIHPTVIVTDTPAATPVLTALQDAKRDCLIARSLRAVVEVEPDVEISVTE